MHFPKLCWRKSAQCFQESSLVLFLLITSFIRKRKQVVLLESFYPSLLHHFTPLAAQLLIYFFPSEQITPSLLQHLPPLATQLLLIFTPLNKYPILLRHFTPPPPPWQPNSYIILPPLNNLRPHSYTILPFSSHCSILLPTLTWQS